MRSAVLVPTTLLALGLGAGAGWLARGAAPRPPTPCGVHGQRLEAHLELLGHGAWYGFTVDRAATLTFTVELPAGVTSTLTWGRLGAGGPGEPAHLPDPAAAESIPLVGGVNGPFERRARALGPHVLFVAQPPLTMGEMRLPAVVRVAIAPDPAGCPAPTPGASR